MPKASSISRAFNAGVWSSLMHGRSDLDRYSNALRYGRNFVATVQGPAVRRSGTYFRALAKSNSAASVIHPFVFSTDQALLMEFSNLSLRFVSKTSGIQCLAPVAITVVDAASPLKFTIGAHSIPVGAQVYLDGFSAASMLTSLVGNVTAVTGTTVTLDIAKPAGFTLAGGETLAQVYSVTTPYAQADLANINILQDQNDVYLFCDGYRVHKLSRYGVTDWRLSEIDWLGGPFMDVNTTSTTLTPGGTGNAVPVMTGLTTPSGAVTGDGVGWQGSAAPTWNASGRYYAFDDDPTSTWSTNIAQSGELIYEFPVAKVITGYTLYAGRNNSNDDHPAGDYNPTSWDVEGSNDGSTWTNLDSKVGYVVWTSYKSLFFKINNSTAYKYYRLTIKSCTVNGLTVYPRLSRIAYVEAAGAVTFNITASSTTGINLDQGFKTTDVGRLIRLRDTDGIWRTVKITARVSATVVTVALTGEALYSLKPTTEWALGYFSDTTGHPICGAFFDDRLYLGGVRDAPAVLFASVFGFYETFYQTDENGTVTDDSALVLKLKLRKVSRITWLADVDKGLVVGTGSAIILVRAAGQSEVITARSAKARMSAARGSAAVQPVVTDRQVLYVQAGKRQVREFVYDYTVDGFKAPSMMTFATHFAKTGLEEIDYVNEPQSIVWARRADGLMLSMSYDRENGVVGWLDHDISGGVVESTAVMPGEGGVVDDLWMVVRRTVNGQTRRFIEQMTRLWEDGMDVVTEAHYVDCGLRYSGSPVSTLYVPHLNGETVSLLVDGAPVAPRSVVDGVVTLDEPGEEIVVGLGYASVLGTLRPEAGAGDGTAQGKTKRVHSVVLRFKDTGGGGTVGPTGRKPDPIRFRKTEMPFGEFVPVYSGDTEIKSLEPGYDQEGTLDITMPADTPLPMTLVAIMPQLHTQDR